MKRSTLLLLLCILLLAGCGKRQESAPVPTAAPAAEAAVPAKPAPPESTPSPEPLPLPESAPSAPPAPVPTLPPTPAPPVTAGVYRYRDGSGGEWILNLKDSGTFSVIAPDHTYSGEGWRDLGDGTVLTGPTEAAGAAPFFDEFGSSLWRIEGESCSPVI